MDTLRTLEILITSRTPLIAIETLEEERAERVLERVAGRLRIPLFVWTMTWGLRRAGAVDSLYETKEPLKALRNAAASDGFSGAEIEQAVVSALYTAFARSASLSTDLILEELKATKPLSVTRAEDVEELREWARGRTVPAA